MYSLFVLASINFSEILFLEGIVQHIHRQIHANTRSQGACKSIFPQFLSIYWTQRLALRGVLSLAPPAKRTNWKG